MDRGLPARVMGFGIQVGALHDNRVLNSELKLLYFDKFWVIVEEPKGVKPIRCKWIYKEI